MLPSYLTNLSPIDLKNREEALLELQKECVLCPNQCRTDRENNSSGKCRSGIEMKVASVFPHFGEEAPLVGRFGSGTIFFTNCNLDCIFCQNYDISQLGAGRRITPEELSDQMIQLQNLGCHNINFVTPTHFIPQIISSLIMAIEKGLEIPLVYNCGGYESEAVLNQLDGIIDIYMPDIKYWSNRKGELYSGVDGYREHVKTAVAKMHEQVGDLSLDKRGIAKRGLLIRHLVLPGETEAAKEIINFLLEEISADTYLNIMDQYSPAYKSHNSDQINRRINADEYSSVVKYARKRGLIRGLESD